jgi:cell wall assembly regulator SMI1
MDVKASWNRIFAWFNKNVPGKTLKPRRGVSVRAIANAELAL